MKLLKTDVLVVGGGMTGVCAAVAAAEMGQHVILIESSGRLGGNFTRSLIGSFNGYTVHDNGQYHMLIRGLGENILNRMREAGGIGDSITLTKLQIIPYDEPILEYVLDQMTEAAGVKVFFHQSACSLECGDRRIKRVTVWGKGGFFDIEANMFVDATGDGDIAAMAGIPSLEDGNGIQFPSMSFYLGGVDMEKAKKLTKQRLGDYMKEASENGEYDLPRIDGTLGILPNNTVRANMGRLKIDGRPINPLDPEEVSWGEREGRRQAFLYLDFLKRHVPGYEYAYIHSLPEHLGVRETRRLKGRYVMTEEDFERCAKFTDGVALSAHPIEQHGQGNTTKWAYLPDGEYVEIPMRCFMPEDIDNLLFGGRCVSARAVAQAAIRAGASCMSMGEAIGTACGLAENCGWDIGRINMRELRKKLAERNTGLKPDEC